MMSLATALRVPAAALRERRRDLWLTARAGRDLVRGLFAFRATAPAVTVFGSARTRPDHPYYALGRAIGRGLTDAGFTVMTGGGPGLMEAVNRGAHEAGGRSIGCRIDLPGEQSHNPFLDRVVSCRHFFTRKVLLFRYSVAFVALPGGFGTLDELFEALTLIQTKKIERFPVVLIGTAYWRPALELMARMRDEAMIDAADLSLVAVVDDVEDAVRYIAARLREQVAAAPRAGRARPGAAGSPLAGQDASPSVVMPVA